MFYRKGALALFTALFLLGTAAFARGAEPESVDLTPISIKTSHGCLKLFARTEDNGYALGLTNDCGEELVLTSMQVADKEPEKPVAAPVWVDSPVMMGPAPALVLSATGDSCIPGLGPASAWRRFRYKFLFLPVRYCSDIHIAPAQTVSFDAPRFTLFRFAGSIGKKPFEVQAIGMDPEDTRATLDFRRKYEAALNASSTAPQPESDAAPQGPE